MAKQTRNSNLGLYQLREHYPHSDGDVIAYDHIIIDRKGPNQEKGVAVIVDYYSHYCVLYPITNQRHTYLLEQFEKNYLTTYGTPIVMIADSEIKGAVWTAFGHLLQTKLSITTSYFPQANPVERINRDVQNILRTFILESTNKQFGRVSDATTEVTNQWPAYLPYVQATLNDRPIAGTRVTPYQVKFGVNYRSPMDLLLNNELPSLPLPNNIEEYVNTKRKILKFIKQIVQKQLTENRAKSILYENVRRKVPIFQVGDFVVRYIKTRQPKMALRMIGPYQILKKLGPARFKIQHVNTMATATVHASQLVRHRMAPKLRNLLKVTIPHLSQNPQGQAINTGDFIVWERRSIAGWDLGMELFVSQVYHRTKKGILMHHYLDEHPDKAGDHFRSVAMRKLAPGYEGFLKRDGKGVWDLGAQPW